MNAGARRWTESPYAAYLKMLEALPIDVFLYYIENKNGTPEERNRKLVNLYLENS